MTIAEALKSGTDSEILLAHVLKRDKSWLFANPKSKLTTKQANKLTFLIRKRANHVPAAYLTGHKEFFGLDFKVSPATLIPRPETELLVELALDRIKNIEYRISNVIDIGTGSGAIIVSLAVILRYSDLSAVALAKVEGSRDSSPSTAQNDKIKFFATDISKSALKIAKQNARRHGVLKKIKFLHSNLLSSFPPQAWGGLGRGRTIIIANLPYLTPEQVKSNPDLKHEPRSALVAGRDGLKYYRELFKQLSQLPTPNSRLLLLEHDPSQVPALKSLAKKYFPSPAKISKKNLGGQGAKLTFHRDLSRKPRVLKIEI